LFGDFLYRWDKVSRFYCHDPHDPESVRRAAAEAQRRVPDERRQRVASALRKLNGENPGIDALELPETVAVVTGQQVGLFGGPAYTIFKALTAAKLARQLTESGIRAVPVFWLATEDHDLDEVNHCSVFNGGTQPVRLTSGSNGSSGGPVGLAELRDVPLQTLREALEGHLYADEVMALVEESYRSGATYGEAFRALMQKMAAGFGLIFFDPMMPEIRELCAPFLKTALEQSGELVDALVKRGKELETAGYHAQVLVEARSSLLFRLENGQRLPLKRTGGEFAHDKLTWTMAQLAAEPEKLSPNALLRPVMQDWLLPTAAYVGGPAEIAYLAQSEVLYRKLLGCMPVPVPRAGFTLLDSRAAALIDKYDVSIIDCFHGEEALRERIASRLLPESLDMTFDEALEQTRSVTDRLQGELADFDPTLGAAMAKSRAKILYQLEKNRRKASREALRRQERVSAGASQLSALVYPERHLQERYYSILPFLAKHGPELLDTLYEKVQSGCPDHLVLTV
jgi:bacillithiol biosynthesis cysteine-adding enzyme BshC